MKLVECDGGELARQVGEVGTSGTHHSHLSWLQFACRCPASRHNHGQELVSKHIGVMHGVVEGYSFCWILG